MKADRRPIDCGRSFSDSQRYLLAFLANHGNGHEGQQARAHAHRARARTAAAMRRGKRLVQVHVDDVEAHVTRTHLAENGVEIGAVVVQQPARVVHDLRHFLDATLEHAAGGRIGEHDAGGIRTHRRLQRFDVDVAIVVDRDFPDHATAHGGGGGVGAVRGDRHDDFVAREIAARAVVGADHGDAGEFAVRAGHGRQRHALHAGDFFQHLLQFVHAGEKSLSGDFPAPADGGPGNPAAWRTGYRPSGCTSSCTNPADRSACRWRS